MDRNIDRQKERQMDRNIDRQIERQIDRQMYLQIDKRKKGIQNFQLIIEQMYSDVWS